ncbi:MAG: autotransporter outer membrane beta-barrel domain-containing protein [Chlamydiales bacterium]|nr:autotransporter outer membrane beta-barrel domain-containing protein [Chlamydiales bacterium]
MKNGIFRSTTLSLGTLIFLGTNLSVEALLAPRVSGGNAEVVARTLDEINPAAGTDLGNIVGILNGLSNAGLKVALNQMQPSLFNAMALSQENNSIRVSSAVDKRMEKLYLTDCTRDCSPNKRIAFWGDLFGDLAKQESIQSQTGFHTSTGGGLVGMDYGCLSNFFVGANLAYTCSDVDFRSSAGSGHISSYYGGIYSTWFNELAYADASFIGAYNHYRASRKIEFTGVDRRAKNQHNGGEFDARIEAGIFFPLKGLDLRPFDTLEYIYVHEGSFSEKGARSLNLDVKAKTSTLLRNELGLGAATCFTFNRWSLAPDVKLSWIREVRFGGGRTRAEFDDTDVSFGVNGMKPIRSLLGTGAGLTGLFLQERLAATVRYNGEFQEHYWDQNINLQVSFAF